jgi:hypothetical protein
LWHHDEAQKVFDFGAFQMLDFWISDDQPVLYFFLPKIFSNWTDMNQTLV